MSDRRVVPWATWSLSVVMALSSGAGCGADGDDPGAGSSNPPGDDSSADHGATSGGDDSGGENSADATLKGGSLDDASAADTSISRPPRTDPACPVNSSTQTSFINLAVAPGLPLDRNQNDTPPDGGTVPTGWNFYNIEGAHCRDGSPTGFYVRYKPSTKLMIYLEGGGACESPHFCDHNPANMNQVFPGGSSNGESFGGSLITVAGLQAPYTDGIFDDTNQANPFKDWNQVYVPYCTGDAHLGTNDNAQLPDGVNPSITNTWHFVGHLNMQKFVSRLVPTFSGLDQVLMTGSSAGGLGAGLNFGMVQDSFGEVPVDIIDDSFPPFTGGLISACLQATVRQLWGLDKTIPSDCAECAASAGGLANLVPYFLHKYPKARFGLVSSLHDQIIRLFLAAGQNNCSDTDPNLLSGLGLQGGDVPSFDGGMYESGLDSLRAMYACTGKVASYFIGTGDPDASTSNGAIDTLHEHVFRPRFFDPLAGPGEPTLAQWTTNFVNGNLAQVGP